MIEIVKKIFRPTYYFLKRIDMFLKAKIFKSKVVDPGAIPIIINNRNRLTTLKLLIDALEKRNCFNIYIIDNASTYPPLLEFYKTIPYKVYKETKNWGHLAIWKSGIYKDFYKDFYVYTDSDVVPVEECPKDFMDFFHKTLVENKDVQKVGFSLKIDDIPDCYAHKHKVLEWESQYYEKKVGLLLYEANIDTTFALYRPGTKGGASLLKMYRTSAPYTARHMPWYINSESLPEEEEYYISHIATKTDWGKK